MHRIEQSRSVPAFLAIVSLVLAEAAIAQTRNLGKQVEAEFSGEPLTTRVAVASFYRYRHEGLGRTLTRLVDTEIYPDGSIKYLVRTGHVERSESGLPYDMFARSFHIKPEAVTKTFPAGARLTVVKTELMDDRLELLLKGDGELGYAKLKFMIGKGFQKKTSWEAVKTFVARGAVTERLETAQKLAADFSALMNRIALLSEPPSGATTAEGRLARANELRDALQSIIRNRNEYAAASKTSPSVSEFAGRLREVEEQIPALEQQARSEHAQVVRAAYDTKIGEMKQLKSRAGAQPARSLSDWQQQEQALKQWDANVRELAELRQQIAGAGGTVAAFDADAELKAIESRRAALAQDRPRLELAQLNAEFKELEKLKIALLDAYTRTFGTPAQRVSASKLIDHLRAMQKNRMAAQKAGQAAAAEQIAQISREIDRVRR